MPCGICGFVGPSDKSLLSKMCRSISHRGPDSTGYYLDDGVGLGVDRLKIIDLVKGDQPIHNEDGSIWIVFNGEIYNYRELRSELEAEGHRFYTDSDTETIVHAYERWSLDCVKHLRGMFAFAIWDKNRKRLFLARDRFGKKPLYYTWIGGVFLFASEIKALLQYSGFQRRINREAVDYFFTYAYIPSPLSIFNGVEKVLPGHYAVYEAGSLSSTQYWDFVLRPNPGVREDALVEELYRTLEDAVKVRLRSDVPLGAFLSGGIDSSTVVSLMRKLSSTPVKTVSIDFEDELSEAKYSRQVAEYLATDHHEFTVTPDAYRILPNLVWHFDEPFADHSLIPTYYLSQVTRKEVTVALSGDGGDELFMGYSFLREPSSYGIYSKVPRWIRRPTLRILRSLPLNRSFRRLANHAYEKDYGSQSPSERYAMRVSIFDRTGLRNLYSKENTYRVTDTYSYVLNLIGRSSSSDSLDSVDYATVRSYLEEDILVKADRMSMANSLEVRCPLLDQNLAEFVGGIPSNLKMNGTTSKYLLKKMVLKKQLLPAAIALRKKQGFGAPVESWMRKQWKDVVAETLDPVVTSNYTGFFDQESVKRLLAEPYINSNRLFAMMVFVTWYKMYIDDQITNSPGTTSPLAQV